MKKALGLIIFALSFSAFAGNNMLILRGRVPATYKVEVDKKQSKQKHRPHWKVVSNERRTVGGPRLSVKYQEGLTLVSLTHP